MTSLPGQRRDPLVGETQVPAVEVVADPENSARDSGINPHRRGRSRYADGHDPHLARPQSGELDRAALAHLHSHRDPATPLIDEERQLGGELRVKGSAATTRSSTLESKIGPPSPWRTVSIRGAESPAAVETVPTALSPTKANRIVRFG